MQRPQYVDKDKIRLQYRSHHSYPNSILRKETACNILFRNAIIKAHDIKFNEDLSIFIDNSFVLEYLKYAEHFVKLLIFRFIIVVKYMIHLMVIH